MNYDALIVTNLPNYYKINLINAIAEKCKIYVVFIAGTEKRRNADFASTEESMQFDHITLTPVFNTRNVINTCLKLKRVIKDHSFNKVILGEWVSFEYWFASLFFHKKKSALMLESNIHSVDRIGIKEQLKKLFLSRISMVFANGLKHAELARLLGFKDEILVNNGLGIINYTQAEPTPRNNDFLYVGRLAKEKNLDGLITAFNELSYTLTIIGEGPESDTLKSMANENIQFLGYINNRELPKYFQSHRALMLVSTHEPWGLVAEEALFYGLPIIVSSVCGIVDSLCFHEKNSVVVEAESKAELIQAIKRINDPHFYSQLVSNIGPDTIIEKDRKQVENYVSWINQR